MQRYSSGADEDIYVDLDVPPNASSLGDALLDEDRTMDVDMESDDLLIVKEILSSPKEAELKREEKKLYLEILKSEKEKRNEELLKVSDYKEIQKQLLDSQKLIAEKEDKIAALSKENHTIKMNICSLYKTAKSERDRLEILLKEANRKVDNLLYKKDLPRNYFEKQSKQTLGQKHKSSQTEPNGDMHGCRESYKRKADINDRSKGGSDAKTRNQKESKGQHKRVHSPSKDIAHSSKRFNCVSEDNLNTIQSANIECSNRSQVSDSNTVPNNATLSNDKNLNVTPNCTLNTTLVEPKSFDRTENCDLNGIQKSADTDNGKDLGERIGDVDSGHKSTLVQCENLDESQKTDLDSSTTLQSVDKPQEPSVQELFSIMQAMIKNDPDTLKDPDTINLIFDNLLPDELKKWFLVYETSQTNALNELKQSFIKSYFEQCSAGTAGSAKKSAFSFFR